MQIQILSETDKADKTAEFLRLISNEKKKECITRTSSASPEQNKILFSRVLFLLLSRSLEKNLVLEAKR